MSTTGERGPGLGLGTDGRLRLAAALAVLATTAGLHTVVLGGAWFVQAVIAIAAVAVTGAGAGVLRLPAWVAVPAQLAALLVVLCVLFVPGQAVLGLLPGPQALAALADLVREGRAVVVTQASPVTSEPGLRLLTTAGAGATALVVDVVAVVARCPALTGPVLLAVHSVPVVFSPGGLPWGWFVLAAAGWTLLLAADGESRARSWGRQIQPRSSGGRTAGGGRPGPWGGSGAVRVAAAAVVVGCAAAAVVVPPLVPGTSSVVLVAGNGQGISGAAANSVNPLLDLRSDLESQGTAEVLRYTSESINPSPLRIVTVDVFDGSVWQPSELSGGTTQSLDDGMPAVPGLYDETPRTQVGYRVTVQALRQQWLPVPYPAASVDVGGRWVVDTSTLNIRAQGRTATETGETYDVQQLAIDPSPEQLRDAPPTPADITERYTQLPEGLPDDILATAQEVAGDEATPFLQAAELQQWFRTAGGFTYSLEAPEPRSANAISDFLQERSGYCVQFASAMALMARTLGIPARVAVGFLPGSQLGDGSWQVTLADAHAWPELYFEGAGWVRFEPTPSSRTGSAPSWTVAPVDPVAPTAPVPGASSSAAAPSSSAASSAAPTTTTAAPTSSSAAGGRTWPVLVVLAVVVGVLAAPLAGRALVRRRRGRRARGPGARAEAAWSDLVEQVCDLGVRVPASATPRQVGRRLEEGLRGEGRGAGAGPGGGAGGPVSGSAVGGSDGGGADSEAGAAAATAVGRLVTAVEQARYGAPVAVRGGRGASGGTTLTDDVRTVVGAVVSQRPRADAWRWRLLPPSGRGHLRRWAGRLVGLVVGRR